MKNQFDTAFGMYKLYPTYDELVAKQKEYLGRLWDYELPTGRRHQRQSDC